MNKKIAVLGAGSWGTALAVSLSKNKHSLSIWDIDKDHKDSLKEERENLKYLPGVRFDDSIKIADTAEEAVYEADIVLFSAPAQHFRNALDGVMPFLTADMVLVNVAKGIEQKSLMRLSEIAKEKLPEAKYVVLSGPSHAEVV